MLPCEHVNESTEYELEATLRILCRKCRDRLLLADDELQFRDQVHHQLTVRTERLLDCVAPTAKLFIVLRQDRPDEAPECLSQGRVRDVSLVLIEFARRKAAAGRYERFMELVDNG